MLNVTGMSGKVPFGSFVVYKAKGNDHKLSEDDRTYYRSEENLPLIALKKVLQEKRDKKISELVVKNYPTQEYKQQMKYYKGIFNASTKHYDKYYSPKLRFSYMDTCVHVGIKDFTIRHDAIEAKKAGNDNPKFKKWKTIVRELIKFENNLMNKLQKEKEFKIQSETSSKKLNELLDVKIPEPEVKEYDFEKQQQIWSKQKEITEKKKKHYKRILKNI